MKERVTKPTGGIAVLLALKQRHDDGAEAVRAATEEKAKLAASAIEEQKKRVADAHQKKVRHKKSSAGSQIKEPELRVLKNAIFEMEALLENASDDRRIELLSKSPELVLLVETMLALKDEEDKAMSRNRARYKLGEWLLEQVESWQSNSLHVFADLMNHLRRAGKDTDERLQGLVKTPPKNVMIERKRGRQASSEVLFAEAALPELKLAVETGIKPARKVIWKEWLAVRKRDGLAETAKANDVKTSVKTSAETQFSKLSTAFGMKGLLE
jgi:hypothetical protein